MPEANSIGLILLAAGASERMGEPKQLLPLNGKPMLRHAAETALASKCGQVVVVLGANYQRVKAAIEGLPVDTVFNPNWQGGMGTSIQAGLCVLPPSHQGAILALADQPLIDAAVYDNLIEQGRASGKPIVASRYNGTVGVPVLFGRRYFEDLMQLAAHEGCKRVIQSKKDDCLLIDCPSAAFDIDFKSDYQDVCQQLAAG